MGLKPGRRRPVDGTVRRSFPPNAANCGQVSPLRTVKTRFKIRRKTLSLKGVVGPIVLDAEDAAVAAEVIAAQTVGMDLRRTPLEALPAFGRKLERALKRRRRTAKLKLWTVTMQEAEAAFQYLFAFSHADAPQVLPNEAMDAVHNVALDIPVGEKRGARSLGLDEMKSRIKAWKRSTDITEAARWIRRLKRRVAEEEAYWSKAASTPRRPLSPLLLKILGRTIYR